MTPNGDADWWCRYEDDVADDVKLRRLQELIAEFRQIAQARNDTLRVGTEQLVLVEGPSRRSTDERPRLTGRTGGWVVWWLVGLFGRGTCLLYTSDAADE